MLEEASPAPSYSIAPSSALMLTRFSRRSSAGITLDVPLYDILPQSRSGTSQLNELLKDDNEFAAIVVVDECDRDARAEVWNKLRNRGPRIRLVTVHSEPEETAGDTRYTPAPELEKSQIALRFPKILQGESTLYLTPKLLYIKLWGSAPQAEHSASAASKRRSAPHRSHLTPAGARPSFPAAACSVSGCSHSEQRPSHDRR